MVTGYNRIAERVNNYIKENDNNSANQLIPKLNSLKTMLNTILNEIDDIKVKVDNEGNKENEVTKKVKDIRTNFLKKNPDRKFNEHDMRNDEIKADAFGEQIAKKNNSHSGKEISSTIIHSKFNKKINDDLYKNTSNIVKRDTYGNAIKNKNGKNQLITQFSRENIRLKKFEKLISEYNQYIFDSKKKIKQLSKELSISDKSDTQKISDLTNKIKNLQKNVTLYETKKNEVIQARNRVKNIIQAIKKSRNINNDTIQVYKNDEAQELRQASDRFNSIRSAQNI